MLNKLAKESAGMFGIKLEIKEEKEMFEGTVVGPVDDGKIKFAHISPVGAMKEAHERSDVNLVLAHLIGDNEYTRFYAESGKYTIMDNGAFELGKPYDPEKLIELGKKIKANCLVLPDYPLDCTCKTLEAAEKWIPEFKKEGFDVFFVPQSPMGNSERYFDAWKFAINNPDIDLIGNSIIGAPNAFAGLPRVYARYHTLLELTKILTPDELKKMHKRVHMLGMLDTVREICLCMPFRSWIYSWDTSAAVWYGLNGLKVKESVKKFDKAVDFNNTDPFNNVAGENIDFIQSLLDLR